LSGYQEEEGEDEDDGRIGGSHRLTVTAPISHLLMKFNKRFILNLAVVAGVVGFSSVCLHSVEEVHYLKSFFPRDFTVEEAFYAAAIELIKVIIIGLPILLVIGVCMSKLRQSKRDSDS